MNAELLSLEVPFTKASILITTRPGGEDLGYLSGFITFQIKPLTQEQAVSLVKKLRYDETVKQSFLKGLEADLFDTHDDFLSNPLLLTIMLMTYSDLAEIPSKMHIFYEQAFDTLFYRHDSSKGMYRRELKSQLAIDDFKDVLSCISASSYIRGQVTLTHTDLLSFIRKAKQTANIPKLTPKNYIDDLVQSVCLLLEDGTRYTYNHRSFQEYFAALFLIQIPTENKIDVYKRYLSRELTDNSLTLAFEINQSVVEKEFIKPMLISVLRVAKSPHELVESWMTGIELERTKRRTRGRSGKIVQRFGKPRYHLINASEFWRFQNYIERMYSKAAKKHIKFGKMTQKAFVEEFGNCEYSEKIKLKGINAKSQEKLDRLGIYEIAKMRLEFLSWLMNDISSRDNRTGESNIESWL